MFTDLYELTMAQAFHRRRMFAPATFSLFIRKYPPNRAYFVSAGLEDVLDYLEKLRFSGASLEYLRTTGLFTGDLLEYLGDLRFTGSVRAIPEGRLFFVDEPVLEVTAPSSRPRSPRPSSSTRSTSRLCWPPRRPAAHGQPRAGS